MNRPLQIRLALVTADPRRSSAQLMEVNLPAGRPARRSSQSGSRTNVTGHSKRPHYMARCSRSSSDTQDPLKIARRSMRSQPGNFRLSDTQTESTGIRRIFSGSFPGMGLNVAEKEKDLGRAMCSYRFPGFGGPQYRGEGKRPGTTCFIPMEVPPLEVDATIIDRAGTREPNPLRVRVDESHFKDIAGKTRPRRTTSIGILTSQPRSLSINHIRGLLTQRRYISRIRELRDITERMELGIRERINPGPGFTDVPGRPAPFEITKLTTQFPTPSPVHSPPNIYAACVRTVRELAMDVGNWGADQPWVRRPGPPGISFQSRTGNPGRDGLRTWKRDAGAHPCRGLECMNFGGSTSAPLPPETGCMVHMFP
ncbi:hypothetical protein GLOTRDRAFT_89726 [Gloeophyllum trabeum ATCC 11539]|uniref:Uncharacterized protein n=1 Tax=Gloeophyllum trabeum (strain ATCC 11539 / FP-39264 / Madison 617) TaxID=670483 RepID=S7S2V0_GLOTA|nr:uncharacterized protein GLOTRDRAFT_89726 [Gloeophyllum trabeum ATCC 11539]EPQ60119.1 hypothetical protein GLOTRDRAFT_89726 [Gloeophyllum trabeum ATCC 11539]